MRLIHGLTTRKFFLAPIDCFEAFLLDRLRRFPYASERRAEPRLGSKYTRGSKYALALVCFSLGSDEVPRVSSGMKMLAKSVLPVPRRILEKHLI